MVVSNLSDENNLRMLMIQAQSGDRTSYGQLLQALRHKSIQVARSILKGYGQNRTIDAEDIAQDVLVAIHNSLHTYRPENNFLAWFHAIVRYKVIDASRKLKETLVNEDKTIEQLADEAAEDWFQFSKDIDQTKDEKKDLNQLLLTLPEKQRAILELTKIQGKSVSEAAAILNYSETDIKVSTHRAIKALKAQMEES